MQIKRLFQQTIQRNIVLGALLCAGLATFAQNQTDKVVIGKRVGTETLDVNGSVRIRILPNSNERVIYTPTSGGDASNNAHTEVFTPKSTVVADQNGVLGVANGVETEFFYMPPILLPLSKYAVDNHLQGIATYTPTSSDSENGQYTVDLHKLYKEQFDYSSSSSNSKHVRSSNSAQLPVYDADKLDFYITYYDKDVFDAVTLTPAGVLTYKVKKQINANRQYQEITPSAKTFMNVVFRIK